MAKVSINLFKKIPESYRKQIEDNSGYEPVDDEDERLRKVLFESSKERIMVEKWAPGIEIEVDIPANGAEFTVVQGSYGTWSNEVYEQGTINKYDNEDTLTLMAGRKSGCIVYIREGIKSKL
mmetsp:Transcript_27811/g.24607  ORF Transcript_27811/g.24607 Transcript_27811/m.24607 type:complete len:122 (-) Transcript_27811:72-437(-)